MMVRTIPSLGTVLYSEGGWSCFKNLVIGLKMLGCVSESCKVVRKGSFDGHCFWQSMCKSGKFSFKAVEAQSAKIDSRDEAKVAGRRNDCEKRLFLLS
jgi:hypothetical protein